MNVETGWYECQDFGSERFECVVRLFDEYDELTSMVVEGLSDATASSAGSV